MTKFIRKQYYRTLLWWHSIPWICSKHMIEKEWTHVGEGDFGYVCHLCNDADKVKAHIDTNGSAKLKLWRARLALVA